MRPTFQSQPSIIPADQQKPTSHLTSASHHTVRFLAAVTLGAALLTLSGLTLTGTVMTLIMATPILILFSPVLVPAGIALFLITTGFMFSGGCGVVALAALSWIYNYVAGKHLVGADRLDRARMRIADKTLRAAQGSGGYPSGSCVVAGFPRWRRRWWPGGSSR